MSEEPASGKGPDYITPLLDKLQESVSSLETEVIEYSDVMNHLRDLMGRFNVSGFPEGPMRLMLNLVKGEMEKLYPKEEWSFKRLAMIHAYVAAFSMTAIRGISKREEEGGTDDIVEFFKRAFTASSNLLEEQFKEVRKESK